MLSKVVKHLILALIILNIPSTMFFYVSTPLGSILSYSVYGLLILFMIIEKKEKPNLWLLAIGILYFTISGIGFYNGEEKDFFIIFLKYSITIVCGSVLVKRVTTNELFFYLILGSLSISIHAVFFPSQYGRYSGFYINPNTAGFISAVAYALTFRIKKGSLKNFAQILVTIGGFFTFSRTFILIWIIMNLLSVRISIKNIRILAAGFGLLVLLTIFGPLLKLNTERLDTFTAVVNNEENSLQKANEASRSETWAHYYEALMTRPIFGNGYGSFSSGGLQSFGVHNSYLLILGEAGIFPFLLFTGLYAYFLHMGVIMFRDEHFILMQGIALFLFLLTFHNFFTTDYVLILSLWIHHRIKEYKKRNINHQLNST